MLYPIIFPKTNIQRGAPLSRHATNEDQRHWGGHWSLTDKHFELIKEVIYKNKADRTKFKEIKRRCKEKKKLKLKITFLLGSQVWGKRAKVKMRLMEKCQNLRSKLKRIWFRKSCKMTPICSSIISWFTRIQRNWKCWNSTKRTSRKPS